MTHFCFQWMPNLNVQAIWNVTLTKPASKAHVFLHAVESVVARMLFACQSSTKESANVSLDSLEILTQAAKRVIYF